MRITRQQLAQVQTFEQFLELRRALVTCLPGDLYESLFSIAISDRSDGAAQIACRALIGLQPPCPETCKHVLERIHESHWFVSFREVSFYLITQFGKPQLLNEARAFIATLPTGEPRSRVDAVVYWASMPASALCEPYHYWQWHDEIEDGADNDRNT